MRFLGQCLDVAQSGRERYLKKDRGQRLNLSEWTNGTKWNLFVRRKANCFAFRKDLNGGSIFFVEKRRKIAKS